MMTIETKVWDTAEYLNTPEDVAAYLDAYLEDGTAVEIRRALKTIARSHGMAAVAKETGLTREALYRSLGEQGNPTLDTLVKVAKALGLRLSLSAQAA